MDATATSSADQIDVTQHLGLVAEVAMKMRITPGSKYWDDAMQAGSVGLLMARKTFDPSRARFSTYAFRMIRWEIQKMMRDTALPIAHHSSNPVACHRVKEKLSHELRRRPRNDEIARHVGVKVGTVDRAFSKCLSLDRTLPANGASEPGSSMRDTLEDRRRGPHDEHDSYLRDILHEMIDRLNPRYRAIVRRYYFDGVPQRQIAKENGVSHQAIFQVIDRSLWRIRTMLQKSGKYERIRGEIYGEQ